MKKRIQKIMALLFGAAILINACGQQEEPTPSTSKKEQADTKKDEKELTKEDIARERLGALDPIAYGNVDGLELEPGTYFSIIGKSADGDYWNNVKKGAEQAVSDLNKALDYEGEDKIKVVYSGPGESGDVDEQVNILDEELARYPDALAISIVDSKSCDVQFDLAAENGIPIVNFDSASSYRDIMARVITNNTQAAKEIADHMAELMEETGEVMVFVHDSKSDTSVERADAFVKEMKEAHPDIKLGNVYYLDKLDDLKETIANEINAGTYAKNGEELKEHEEETKAEAGDITDEEAMDFIFAKNPDVTAIYGTADTAVMKAVENCERLEKEDIKIAGFDASEEQVEALKEGKVSGLLAQNPYGMGYASIVACARSILDMGNEAEVDAGYAWVTEENVEDRSIIPMLY